MNQSTCGMARSNQTQYILELELAGFNDSLDMMYERNRRVKDDSKILGR